MESRTNLSQQTIDGAVIATRRLHSSTTLKATVGAQRITSKYDNTSENGTTLPAGATRVDDAQQRSGSESRARHEVQALYGEAMLSLGERVMLTGGVRRDDQTDVEAKAVLNHSAGITVVVRDSGSHATMSWLDALRLRSAYGRVGRYPGISDSVRPTFAPPNSNGVIASPKPETSTEWEVGADGALFGGRSSLAFTSYNKRTDNLLLVSLLGSTASGTATSVENRGVEFTLNQHLVSNRQLAASVGVTASANRNRMTRLAGGIPPIFTGNRTTQRNVPGYPLYGLWSRTYDYSDVNGDGIITFNELSVSDTARFIGSSFPTRELSVTPTVLLFGNKLRLTAQIDRKWGFRKFNNTLRHQCQSVSACRGVNDRSASLDVQAAAVAASQSIMPACSRMDRSRGFVKRRCRLTCRCDGRGPFVPGR